MYQMHWKFGKAAPSATNINFLNFCSNCQVVAEKIARFKKVCVCSIFPLSFPFFSRRISEPGNQINSKIDMCIICCSKKITHQNDAQLYLSVKFTIFIWTIVKWVDLLQWDGHGYFWNVLKLDSLRGLVEHKKINYQTMHHQN